MAEMIGKIRTCDRCGKAVFLQKTGEKILDGGYTSNEIHEEAKDWDLVTTHNGVKNLCPECADEYQQILCAFVNGESTSIPRKIKASIIMLEFEQEARP